MQGFDVKLKIAYYAWLTVRTIPRIVASILAFCAGAIEIVFCIRAFAGGWIPFWGEVNGDCSLGCIWLFLGGPLFITIAYWIYMGSMIVVSSPCEVICRIIRKKYDPDYDPSDNISEIFD